MESPGNACFYLLKSSAWNFLEYLVCNAYTMIRIFPIFRACNSSLIFHPIVFEITVRLVYMVCVCVYTGWLITGGTSGKGVILRKKRGRKCRIKICRLRLCFRENREKQTNVIVRRVVSSVFYFVRSPWRVTHRLDEQSLALASRVSNHHGYLSNSVITIFTPVNIISIARQRWLIQTKIR